MEAAIRWPEEFHPDRMPVHVRNELSITAAPEAVWAWLVRAELWPTWYSNSANVRIVDGPRPDLALGTRFRWRTFGVTIESTVREFVPGERLAWDARAAGIRAYHAWLITRTAAGCHVLTEETQSGILARLGKLFMPHRMYKYHQMWLAQLRVRAETTLPHG